MIHDNANYVLFKFQCSVEIDSLYISTIKKLINKSLRKTECIIYFNLHITDLLVEILCVCQLVEKVKLIAGLVPTISISPPLTGNF